MVRLFTILTFLLALVIGASNSKAVEGGFKGDLKCASLFETNSNLDLSIADLIAPKTIKRMLYQQSKFNENTASFIKEYLDLLDFAYMNRLAEITYEGKYADLSQSGFSSPREAKLLKDEVLNKQIRVLAVIRSKDLTPEFRESLKRVAIQVYSVDITKEELVKISNQLSDTLASYNFRLF